MESFRIGQFSKKLISAENRINTAINEYKIWYSLWFDIVGVLYSFYKVFPLLQDNDRQHDEIIKGAKKNLDSMKFNEEIEDKKHDAWFDGYYLNNVEFRISLAFHCLLKTCYPCNTKHPHYRVRVPQLIDNILKHDKCPKCQNPPISLNKRVKNILNDFKNCHNQPTVRPNTTGKYLFEVHSRVNSLKHTPDPVEDLIPTRKRMKEAWEGLSGIYDLFSYIAKKRGALK